MSKLLTKLKDRIKKMLIVATYTPPPTVTVTLSPSSLPAATQGSAYSQQLTAAGGSGPYSFRRSAGSIPAGLSLSTAGLLSGTPTGSGDFSFTAEALDIFSNVGSRAYTLAITASEVPDEPGAMPTPILDFAPGYTTGNPVFPAFLDVPWDTLFEGDWVRVEVDNSLTPPKNGDGSYVSPTLVIDHQLTQADFENLDIDLSSSGYSPWVGAGACHAMYWREGDPIITGDWSNDLAMTVVVSAAHLDPANKATYATLSGTPPQTILSATGSLEGAMATLPAQAAITQFEVTLDTFAEGVAGFVEEPPTTYDGTRPGWSGAAGFCADWWAGELFFLSGDSVIGTVGWSGRADGDVLTLVLNKTAHTLAVHLNGNTTPIATLTGFTPLSTYYAYVAPKDDGVITCNFGADAFELPLDTGVTFYA